MHLLSRFKHRSNDKRRSRIIRSRIQTVVVEQSQGFFGFDVLRSNGNCHVRTTSLPFSLPNQILSHQQLVFER